MSNKRHSFTIVIFGVTGDLYRNKLASALFNLFVSGLLPANFNILGFARRPLTDKDFRELTKEALSKQSRPKKLDSFLKRLKYIQGDLENLESFKNLAKELTEADARQGVCSNKIFYLAVPPHLYEAIFKNISRAGLTLPCASGSRQRAEAWTRVLVEKPFGNDIKTAEKLDKLLGQLFDESQIFRIDHYLAKETIKNFLAFRFSNKIFESLWNKKSIEKVRIIFHESQTVGKRGAFYDTLGALSDVGQNHMLQMLALVAMEKPTVMDAGRIKNARAKVLEKTIVRHDQNRMVRGQYAGYWQELQVKRDSKTETFFRVTLEINNKRWQGVPFELETGKALAKSEVFIEVCFKKLNACFPFRISSDKKSSFDAYEKVFYDCILGDQTLFTSTAEIMGQWRIVEEIIKKWRKLPLVIYKKGSRAQDIGKNSSSRIFK